MLVGHSKFMASDLDDCYVDFLWVFIEFCFCFWIELICSFWNCVDTGIINNPIGKITKEVKQKILFKLRRLEVL